MEELTKFNPLEAQIASLKKDYGQGMVITDGKTYKGVRNAFTVVSSTIRQVKAIETELKTPHMEALDKIREASRKYQEELAPIKDALQDTYRAWDRKKEVEKKEKEEAERRRKKEIERMLNEFVSNHTPDLKTMDVFRLLDLQAEIQEYDIIPEQWAEYLPQVEAAQSTLYLQTLSAIGVSTQALKNKYVQLGGEEDPDEMTLQYLSSMCQAMELMEQKRKEREANDMQEIPSKEAEEVTEPARGARKTQKSSAFSDEDTKKLLEWFNSVRVSKSPTVSGDESRQVIKEFRSKLNDLIKEFKLKLK